MTAHFSGGCACGAIRYECSSSPIATLNCHCLDCQKSSGAPFASGVIVPTQSIEVNGSPKEYTVQASSGATTSRKFCQNCGSPLFTTGKAMPDFTSIRFTTLDNQTDFQPALDIWTSSSVPWICLDGNIPHFDKSS